MMWSLLGLTALAAPVEPPPAIGPNTVSTRVVQVDDIAVSPPPEDASYGAVDVADIVVVRPQGKALQEGFSYGALELAMDAALRDRVAAYDFVLALNTSRLPTQFTGAAAFYLGFNNDDHEGTGTGIRISPTVPVKAILWMNTVDMWSGDLDYSRWVFGQELGHHWLAFPMLGEVGTDNRYDLLGRDLAHWSYWLDTPNSPMEGNRWLDNGDGSFTTDLEADYAFSPLDLYMMGLVDAEDVPDTFYIVPDDSQGRSDGAAPEWLYGNQPLTVTGARVDVSVEDIIAYEGPRLPASDASQKDFRILTMLVLTEREVLTDELLAEVAERQSEWQTAWSDLTGARSTVSFAIEDEGRSMPPPPESVALVPRGAW